MKYESFIVGKEKESPPATVLKLLKNTNAAKTVSGEGGGGGRLSSIIALSRLLDRVRDQGETRETDGTSEGVTV